MFFVVTGKPSIKLAAIFLFASIVSIAPQTAKAADSNEPEKANTETRPRRVVETAAPTVSESATPEPLQVGYVLYDRSIIPVAETKTETRPEPGATIDPPRTFSFNVKAPEVSRPSSVPYFQDPPRNVASTAPMTAGEKFEVWFKNRFLNPGAYIGSAWNGMWKELNDNDDFKEDTVGNYFADSMTRAARSFAFSATAGFYERAFLASILKQDPRYHRAPGRRSATSRLMYAVTRVFVTQGDRCACNQPNISFLLGGAGAAVTANLWERSERTGPWHTFRRYYTHIYMAALANIAKEIIGGQ